MICSSPSLWCLEGGREHGVGLLAGAVVKEDVFTRSQWRVFFKALLDSASAGEFLLELCPVKRRVSKKDLRSSSKGGAAPEVLKRNLYDRTESVNINCVEVVYGFIFGFFA